MREMRFYCAECQKGFSHKSWLRIHLVSHTGDQLYTCSHCKKRYSTRSNLLRHWKIHHEGEPKKERGFSCPWCQKSFSQKSLLKLHERVHTGEQPFVCPQCGKRFTQKGNFQRHQKKIHAGTTSENERHLYHAESDQHFNEKTLLPCRTNTEEALLSCAMCEKSFNHLSMLIKHQRVHTGEKPFICSVCGMSFTLSGNLKRHQKVHTKKQLFSCSYCTKRFNRNDNLHIHQKIHMEDLLKKKKLTQICFSGSQCDDNFNIKKDLKHHQRVHNKWHSCTECEKRFTLKSHLIKHQKTHTHNQLKTLNSACLRSVKQDHHCIHDEGAVKDSKKEKKDDIEYVEKDMKINRDKSGQKLSTQCTICEKIQSECISNSILSVPAVIIRPCIIKAPSFTYTSSVTIPYSAMLVDKVTKTPIPAVFSSSPPIFLPQRESDS
ncbi:uncharacterized protein LOC144766864 [Lissotriton helveticus]